MPVYETEKSQRLKNLKRFNKFFQSFFSKSSRNLRKFYHFKLLFSKRIKKIMISSESFFLSSGLFDFDITFLGEAILFLLFSLVVTFAFLVPVSKQLNDRTEFIDFNLRKAALLTAFGSNKLSNCVEFLTKENNELARQIKLTRNYVNLKFDEEIQFVQKENGKLLSKLKGEIGIKSAYLLSNVTNELVKLTESFFAKKFQSIS